MDSQNPYRPLIYITFGGYANGRRRNQTFGPYFTARIDQDPDDRTLTAMHVAQTIFSHEGPEPEDAVLATQRDGIWTVNDGLEVAPDAPPYTGVMIHQKGPDADPGDE